MFKQFSSFFIYFKNYHIVSILDKKIGYRAHEVDVALETFKQIFKSKNLKKDLTDGSGPDEHIECGDLGRQQREPHHCMFDAQKPDHSWKKRDFL